VCLLFSHVNPAHERECSAIIAEAHPGIHVIVSCDTDGAAREYERMVSTCFEAWLRPWHLGTLRRLEDGLRARDFRGRIAYGDSRGFLLDPASARQLAISQVASGPAAAAIAASGLCRHHGIRRAVMLDIGSVSTDIVLIEDYEPAAA